MFTKDLCTAEPKNFCTADNGIFLFEKIFPGKLFLKDPGHSGMFWKLDGISPPGWYTHNVNFRPTSTFVLPALDKYKPSKNKRDTEDI